jgi:hypothetical protein
MDFYSLVRVKRFGALSCPLPSPFLPPLPVAVLRLFQADLTADGEDQFTQSFGVGAADEHRYIRVDDIHWFAHR